MAVVDVPCSNRVVSAPPARQISKKEGENLAEWISVKDRLPDFGMRVLVSAGSFVGESYYTSAHTWYRFTGIPLRICISEQVTHWMPLPDPLIENERQGIAKELH